jgi:1-deoxy-D-xylulose 5-phosphate reductoisomerase
LPIIINAANEEAIELFRMKHIKFNEIVLLIGKTIKHFGCKDVKTLNNVYEIDKRVRDYIKRYA